MMWTVLNDLLLDYRDNFHIVNLVYDLIEPVSVSLLLSFENFLL